MLKSIFFHAITERLPMGEELDKELIVQVNPSFGKPYCTQSFFSPSKGFWKERGNHPESRSFENVVAWALMPEPSHHF